MAEGQRPDGQPKYSDGRRPACVRGTQVTKVREDIKKACFFWAMPKGGGVQLESKSFEIVLLSPILTNFWTLNGWEGEGG